MTWTISNSLYPHNYPIYTIMVAIIPLWDIYIYLSIKWCPFRSILYPYYIHIIYIIKNIILYYIICPIERWPFLIHHGGNQRGWRSCARCAARAASWSRLRRMWRGSRDPLVEIIFIIYGNISNGNIPLRLLTSQMDCWIIMFHQLW